MQKNSISPDFSIEVHSQSIILFLLAQHTIQMNVNVIHYGIIIYTLHYLDHDSYIEEQTQHTRPSNQISLHSMLLIFHPASRKKINSWNICKVIQWLQSCIFEKPFFLLCKKTWNEWEKNVFFMINIKSHVSTLFHNIFLHFFSWSWISGCEKWMKLHQIILITVRIDCRNC